MRPFLLGDFAEMANWYAARKMPVPDAGALPPTGFIVPGVAAGFLYRTDSTVCFIEGYITNPEAAPFQRDLALDAITFELLKKATELGCRWVVALTDIPGIAKRARKHGFEYLGSQTMMKKEMPCLS